MSPRRRCKGFDVSNDPREPPLRACTRAANHGKFCELHVEQAERQETLLRYLRPGWRTALVAKRGRPKRKDEADEVLAAAREHHEAPDEESDALPDMLNDRQARRKYLFGD